MSWFHHGFTILITKHATTTTMNKIKNNKMSLVPSLTPKTIGASSKGSEIGYSESNVPESKWEIPEGSLQITSHSNVSRWSKSLLGISTTKDSAVVSPVILAKLVLPYNPTSSTLGYVEIKSPSNEIMAIQLTLTVDSVLIVQGIEIVVSSKYSG